MKSLSSSKIDNQNFQMTIYFLRFFRFYTSQKIYSPKSLSGVTGVTGNTLKIKNTMKNMHDTSHKKLK
jgi:hypothetical protein